jgi:hypothetical protein
MDIVNVDNFRCGIQEQKEVPVWYIGIYLPISSTGFIEKALNKL